MKKILALMLALAMALSLVACGKEDASASQSQTESSQSGAVSEVIEDPGPRPIDTRWASNEFEMMIPRPPFYGWEVTVESEDVYAIRVGGLSDEPRLDTSDFTEPLMLPSDRVRLVRYLNTLPDYGLTVEEIGKGYKWLVTNPEGASAEFTCAEGFCWITFRK
jgi:hypothetical protein